MRYYLMHWKRVFDYKGTSTREEYRGPLIVVALLAALTAVCWAIGSFADESALMFAGFAAGVLFVLHVPPMMALTVRRLRDAGKSPLLSVVALIAGVGTVIVMIVCLFSVSATGYLPMANRNVCVYGPPPGYGSGFDPSDNVNEDVYGPPEMFDGYDPEDNATACVYGPPEMLYGEDDVPEEETAITQEEGLSE
jgi:uncharacterized membrane protein YhaH (DUF805 family)